MIVHEDALLAVLSNTPESASTIYRRYAGLHPKKNLTPARRNERRAIAIKLERMAQRGVIQRGEGDSEYHPVPVYSLKPSP